MTRCSYSLGMMDQELIDDLELETRFGLKKPTSGATSPLVKTDISNFRTTTLSSQEN